MEKSNVKRLVGFGIGAVVCFFVLPLILEQLPEEPKAMGLLILVMVINQILVGVVGWQANYIPKFGIYLPAAVIAVYLVSTMILYGQANFSMEFTYLETGYIAYFLKKLLTRRQRQQERQAQKPFPKGVSRKK